MEKRMISEYRTVGLLCAEWMAGFCILFPVILTGRDLRTVVLSIVTGLLFWCLFVSVLKVWTGPGRGCLKQSEARSGGKLAVWLCFAGFCCFTAYTAVFIRLWSELAKIYFAPETLSPVLCAVPLAACAVLPGRRSRLRADVLCPTGAVLIVLTAVLAFLAVNVIPAGSYRAVQTGRLTEETERILTGGSCSVGSVEDILRCGFEIFACMGGSLLPFLAGRFGTVGGMESAGFQAVVGEPAVTAGPGKEYTERRCSPADGEFTVTVGTGKGDMSGAVRFAGCICAVTAGAFCVAASFLLAPEDSWLFDFPALEALRETRPFGMDVGRLDTVFVLLMLAGLTATVAGGLWCVRQTYDYLYTAGAALYRERLSGRVSALPDIGAAGRYRGRPAVQYVPAADDDRRYREEFSQEFSDTVSEKPAGTYRIKFTKRISGMTHALKTRFYGGQMPSDISLHQIGWWIVLLTVFAMAVGFRSAFTAIAFYRAFHIQLLVPVTAGFSFALILLLKFL